MKTPAVLGGSPSVREHPLEAMRWPIVGDEEAEAIRAVLEDGDLSTHPVTRELESDYCRLSRRRFALAHCNGTAALLAAFFALDLEPGDEILVPSATFWASVVPMLWLGLVPVFCESEAGRMGIDPEDAAARITPRTRAMVVVHLWGLPSRMTALQELAGRHGLKIVEDASHAHGARWRGKPCGGLGDVSVFSLQSSKLAPAGEGGMFLTDDESLYRRAVSLGDMLRLLELDAPERRFAGTTFGIKTRLAPISAAVARVQLKHLERRNAQRRRNCEFLSHRLEALGLETYLPPPHIGRTYFEFVVRYPEREAPLPRPILLEALRAEGCRVSEVRYPLLHQQPLFTEGAFQRIARINRAEGLPSYRAGALPRTEGMARELLCLPSFPSAPQRLLEQYAEAFETVFSAAPLLCRHLAPVEMAETGGRS